MDTSRVAELIYTHESQINTLLHCTLFNYKFYTKYYHTLLVFLILLTSENVINIIKIHCRYFFFQTAKPF